MRSLLLALTLMLSSHAFANDGGIAFVAVKGVNPGPMRDGQVIKFFGEDAGKFMQLLPSSRTVLDIMVPPQEAALRKLNERSLLIASNGWNLVLGCSGVKIVDEPTANGSSQPRVVPAPQVECQISLHKVHDPFYKFDLAGDGFPLDLNDATQNTCR
jgi:hypothetical protein